LLAGAARELLTPTRRRSASAIKPASGTVVNVDSNVKSGPEANH
jgi:hypothetical protein